MGSGESVAKTVNETINESMTNIVATNSSKCGQDTVATQTLNFNNIETADYCSLDMSNISQNLVLESNFTCEAAKQNDFELLKTIQNKLKQETESKVSGIPIGNPKSTAENINKTINRNLTNINIQNISECAQRSMAQQKLGIAKIKASCPYLCKSPTLPRGMSARGFKDVCTITFNNIGQEMKLKAVGDCVSNDTNVSKMVEEVTNIAEQSATSTVSGFDFTGSLLVFIPILLIIAAIFILPKIIRLR